MEQEIYRLTMLDNNDPERIALKAMTAQQIADSHSIRENKSFAKKLGIKGYSRLKEIEVAKLIKEMLNA